MSAIIDSVCSIGVICDSPIQKAREESRRQIQTIAEIMEHMNISDAEVADDTGLSRQTVYRVRKGAPAKHETVIAIRSAVFKIVKSKWEACSILMGTRNEESANA